MPATWKREREILSPSIDLLYSYMGGPLFPSTPVSSKTPTWITYVDIHIQHMWTNPSISND